MRRGPVGTDAVNRRLQAILNPLPPSAAAPRGGARGLLRPGDRVMQQQNNYDREVVNGDWGTVVSVDDSGGAVVSFVTESPVAPRESPTSTPQVAPAHGNTPWRLVEYSAAEARKQLALSYAVSVHKAQGNEWPVVVLMLHMSHYIMLTRGLIYTALCRAQELSIVVGSNKVSGPRVQPPSAAFTCLMGVVPCPLLTFPSFWVTTGTGDWCARGPRSAPLHLPDAAHTRGMCESERARWGLTSTACCTCGCRGCPQHDFR